jgi:cell division protein FtsQ
LKRLGRVGRRIAEVGVLAAAVAGLVVLGRWTHAYVTTSSYFAAAPAEVSGNERVSAARIQELSGLPPGTNIFTVSTAEAGRRIAAHPWIASATVRRRLPRQLVIEVVERRPVALIRAGALYLIDADGVVFKRLEPGDPVDLPVITGAGLERAEEDHPGAGVDVREALALIDLWEESGIAAQVPLGEVHVEQDGSLSVYTDREATNIRLGRPPFRRKLQRLMRLMRELRSQHAVADYVYLEESDDDVQPDRAVVRLRP